MIDDGYTLAGDPTRAAPQRGYAIDLIIVKSAVDVTEDTDGRATIMVRMTMPYVGRASVLSFEHFERVDGWRDLSLLERDRRVFDAILWFLSHELAERLTRDGAQVVDPHPTFQTPFPDVQRWAAEHEARGRRP